MALHLEPPHPVVLDCGTGYTKMGFAGNLHVGDWDLMERFWLEALHSYLRIDPADHHLVVTEPALNPPEAREAMAEIAFETLGVPGLFIGVQAVLALYAAFAAAEGRHQLSSLTGVVVDAGEGSTTVVPVVEGYVLSSSITTVPVCGRDATDLVRQLLWDRKEPVPPEMSLEVARSIKEAHGYVCGDMAKEFLKHEQQPHKYLQQYKGVDRRTREDFVVDVGYERFMASELYFTPGLVPSSAAGSTGPGMANCAQGRALPHAVDAAVQRCPIDSRRALYGNVVLSGGSSLFKSFGSRLERDVQQLANTRLGEGTTAIGVRVVSHPLQRNAAWFGGSVLAMSQEFTRGACRTRQEYEEYGPSICRANYVFKDL